MAALWVREGRWETAGWAAEQQPAGVHTLSAKLILVGKSDVRPQELGVEQRKHSEIETVLFMVSRCAEVLFAYLLSRESRISPPTYSSTWLSVFSYMAIGIRTTASLAPVLFHTTIRVIFLQCSPVRAAPWGQRAGPEVSNVHGGSYRGLHSPRPPVPGCWMSSSNLCGHQAHMQCTYNIHASKTHT